MKNHQIENKSFCRKTRRSVSGGLLSFVLALSLVLSPVGVGNPATGNRCQIETVEDAERGESVTTCSVEKQAGTAEWRIHYQNLTDDEKTVYDTIDSLMERFSPIDLTWEEIIDKASEEGAAGAFREYLESGQAIKLELSRDYGNEEGENAINTGVRYAYVADHPLDMRAQLCGILSYIDGSTVYVCLYYDAGYRDFDRYQQEADTAYE